MENKHNYQPLYLIITLLLLVTVVLSFRDSLQGNLNIMQSMTYLMAGFFLVFSGFKLLDLDGFAEGYRSYDIIAKRIPAYGYIYPFLELGLGLAYATSFQLFYTNIFTLVLMLIGSIGIVISLAKKHAFHCACLGTIIKIPLTYITLIEDLAMATMALIMIIFAL